MPRAKRTKTEPRTRTKTVAKVERPPRSLAIFERGISTGTEFAGAMSALMSDLIAGSVSPQIANAVCNAGGKLLKVVEMQHRWGRRKGQRGAQVLELSK